MDYLARLILDKDTRVLRNRVETYDSTYDPAGQTKAQGDSVADAWAAYRDSEHEPGAVHIDRYSPCEDSPFSTHQSASGAKGNKRHWCIYCKNFLTKY